MANTKSILVNDKEYKVQKLPVFDTIDLQIEVMSNCGGLIAQAVTMYLDIKNGREVDDSRLTEFFNSLSVKGLSPLKAKIMKQVITPENKFLSDESEAEMWFSRPENQGDVWQVLIQAGIALLGEYLPSFVQGIVADSEKKMTENTFQSLMTAGRKP